MKGLGFPIVNDPLYNSPKWGTSRFSDCGVENKEETQICEDKSGNWSKSEEEQKVIDSIPTNIGRERRDKDDNEHRTSVMNGLCVYKNGNPNNIKIDENIDTTCYGCMDPMPDPTPEELILYLHSLQYTVLGKTFKTTIPEWAEKNQNFKIPESYVSFYLKDYEIKSSS